MRKNFTSSLLRSFWVSVFLFCGLRGWVQEAGDYRSKADGNWDDNTKWQVFNGTIWATATLKPSAGDNVFIQASHTMTLRGDEACKDLSLCNKSGETRLDLATYVLSVNGQLRSISNSSAVTSSSNVVFAFSSTLSGTNNWIKSTTGKISIVGNTRTLTAAAEWGNSNAGVASPNGFDLEIKLNPGQLVTANTGLKARSFNIVSGTLEIAGANRLAPDQGSDGTGDFSIQSGAAVISDGSGTGNSAVIGRATTGIGGALTINPGGLLKLTGSLPRIAMASIANNGTVEYAAAGNQTLLQATNSGINVSAYNNLVFSGGGTKTTPASINMIVNGTLSLQGTAVMALGATSSLAYGANGTLEYAGSSAQSTGTSPVAWPTTNGPSNLTVNNSNGVTLNATGGRTINGMLALTNGTFAQTTALALGNGATIARSGGSLAAAPVFGSTVNVVYNQFAASITAGNEIPTSVTTLKDVTINNTNGVTLNTTTNVNGTVAFGNVNNTTLSTGGLLVLKSTSGGTAKVADLTNNGINTGNAITGNVTVERYLPARRAWKLLTAPVRGGGTVYANWQNNGSADGTTGVEIWGPGGNPATNGLVNSAGSNSMLKFDAVAGAWANVTNTKTEALSSSAGANNGGFADNKGFLLFATGPFGSNKINPATGAAETTLRATGTLQTGDQKVPLSTAQSFTLFPNPYASPLDFSKFAMDASNSASIQNYFWLWDATTAGSGNYGTYKLVFQYTPGVYRILPYDPLNGLGNPNTASSAGDLLHIQSGQTVFLYNKINSSFVTVRESHKSTPATTPSLFRTASVSKDLNVSLYKSNNLLDGVMVKMDNSFSAAVVDDEDVAKPWNTYENFALYSNGKVLMLESRPEPAANEACNFLLYNLTANQDYKLVFSANNLSLPGLSAYLEDAYQHTSTPINSSGLTEVTFTATGDPATNDVQRFKIVFGLTAPLPLNFTTVKAVVMNQAVKVEWTASQEQNTLRYDIERSVDGIQFTTAAQVPAKNASGLASYEWLDNHPASAINYYRIKAINHNGESRVSPIVKAMVGDAKSNGFVVYPNPIKGQNVTLQISLPKGEYKVKIANAAGQLLLQQTLQHAGGISSEVIQLPSTTGKGLYQIFVADHNGQNQNKASFVIQ